MVTPDLSFIEAYLPLLSFMIVFVVLFAVLAKSKILGDNKFVNLLLSFMVAVVFVSLTSAREFVINITPWFAVFIIVAAFILIMAGFGWKIPEGFTKGLGVILVLALIVLFLVSAYMSFSNVPVIERIADWIKSPRVYGAIILVVVGAIVSFILTRK